MAKRMAISAHERKTSSNTNPRKNPLTSLSSNLVRLCVARMPERSQSSPADRAGFLPVVIWGKEKLVSSRRVRDHRAHEINPDGQRRVASGFVLAQLSLFIKSDP